MNKGFSHLTSCEVTHRGNFRQKNEDAVLCLPNHGVFCVADGMGGHQGGEMASSQAVLSLHNEFMGASSKASRKTLVGRALNRASLWIKTKAAASGISAAGTTAVVLLFERNSPSEALLIHAGDSRGYRFHCDRMIRLTKDHTFAEAAGIEDENSLPPIFRGVITRAVGVERSVLLEETPTDVEPGDVFLLCSDGLTRMVDEPSIERILKVNQNRDLPMVADLLVDAALHAGGMDNISVILVRVGMDLHQSAAYASRLTEPCLALVNSR